MLEPEYYPATLQPSSKQHLLRSQAKAVGLGGMYSNVPHTIAYSSHTNRAGLKMGASTLSGQEVMGLNDGSKKSTLVTYLADAKKYGAEMYCLPH